uniref:receptor protein-tyrosine kinase n=1 Tax=Magallana gigas TaxID=29159 RepID=K1PBB3_MAGGI
MYDFLLRQPDVNRSANIPRLSARYVTGTDILLTWSSPPTPYYTRYLLQIRTYQTWTTITEIPTTSYLYHNPNPCSTVFFRITAVNQYGMKGFSAPYSVYAPSPPSAPLNGHLMKGAMFYCPVSKEFAGILEVEGIQAWRPEDIEFYQWSTLPTVFCRNINSLIIPIFDPLSSTDAVRAVSKCGKPGPYSNITIDLSVNPPDVVENVTLRMDLNHPQIWLKIAWNKPSDLGSMKAISHYVMRWGKVSFPSNFILAQAEYTHEPLNTTLANNIVEFGIQVQEEPNAIYGFQIMPVAPTQVIEPIEYDKFQVYTIELKNRTSCQNNNLAASRISCDEDGVSVIQVSNTLDITVIWRRPSRSRRTSADKNDTNEEKFYEKYAVQLGEVESLPPPAGQRLVNTNVTVVESICEETFLPSGKIYTLCSPDRDHVVFRGLQSDLLYGVRVIGLNKSEKLPSERSWQLVDFKTFTLEEPIEIDNSTSSTKKPNENRNEILAIVAGVFSVVLLVVLLLLGGSVRRQRKRKLSSLDNRLLFGETNPDNPYNQIERAMLTATTLTVVADKWEIPHSCVRIGRVLGSGAFGYVVKGRINRSILKHRGIKEPVDADQKNIYVSVAVKLIQEDASETNKEDFLREIRLMKGIGYHRNVISMLGCCTLRDPICLIVEHASRGDLLSYLRNIRKNLQQHINAEYVNQDSETVGPQELLSFSRQISTGMEFLTQKGFIHRDLAARNILVDKKNVVKIGDFGLTRYTYDNKVYVNRKGGRLPLKWMSVEAIKELTFSTASDVWSFGVLLFEIVTLGGTPYPTIDTRDLLRELENGYRMEKPENCSEEIKIYYHVHEEFDNNTGTGKISSSGIQLQLSGLFAKTNQDEISEDNKIYDVIEQADDVTCPDAGEEMLGNDCSCSEPSEDKDEEHSSRTTSDTVSLPNNRMVTFSRDSLKTSPVRKRIRQGSPHVNKKNSILSFQTTDAITDKYGYASRLCRHEPLTSNSSKSSSNSSSPELERVPRNSILDCDADESSVGSSCSKCSTSSNGDDDVFYPNSYGDLHRGPPTPYKLVHRPNRYGHNARKGITTTPNPISPAKEDMQNDSGVSTSSASELRSINNRIFVFPPDSNRLRWTNEGQSITDNSSSVSDSDTKTISQDNGMSTDTCVWDSDEQTLDTYV